MNERKSELSFILILLQKPDFFLIWVNRGWYSGKGATESSEAVYVGANVAVDFRNLLFTNVDQMYELQSLCVGVTYFYARKEWIRSQVTFFKTESVR